MARMYRYPDGTRSTEPPPRMPNGRTMTANEYARHKAGKSPTTRSPLRERIKTSAPATSAKTPKTPKFKESAAQRTLRDRFNTYYNKGAPVSAEDWEKSRQANEAKIARDLAARATRSSDTRTENPATSIAVMTRAQEAAQQRDVRAAMLQHLTPARTAQLVTEAEQRKESAYAAWMKAPTGSPEKADARRAVETATRDLERARDDHVSVTMRGHSIAAAGTPGPGGERTEPRPGSAAYNDAHDTPAQAARRAKLRERSYAKVRELKAPGGGSAKGKGKAKAGQGRAKGGTASDGGHWVTVNGHPVFIKD